MRPHRPRSILTPTCLLLALVACGSGDREQRPAPDAAGAPDEAGAQTERETAAEGSSSQRRRQRGGSRASAKVEPLPGEPGVLSGTVRFEGTPPKRKKIAMGGVAGCETHGEPVLTEQAIVTDGRVQNVFVRIKKGIDPESVPPVPDEPAVMSQEGCVYTPHMLGIRVGQKLLVRNGDGVTHNVNARPKRTNNPSFNKTQTPGSADIEAIFEDPEIPVPIGCDFHPWMKAWIAVVEHPHFAVSAVDGTWSIPGLPPGKYELEVWHETFGRDSVSVVLSEEDGARVDFTYSEP